MKTIHECCNGKIEEHDHGPTQFNFLLAPETYVETLAENDPRFQMDHIEICLSVADTWTLMEWMSAAIARYQADHPEDEIGSACLSYNLYGQMRGYSGDLR